PPSSLKLFQFLVVVVPPIVRLGERSLRSKQIRGEPLLDGFECLVDVFERGDLLAGFVVVVLEGFPVGVAHTPEAGPDTSPERGRVTGETMRKWLGYMRCWHLSIASRNRRMIVGVTSSCASRRMQISSYTRPRRASGPSTPMAEPRCSATRSLASSKILLPAPSTGFAAA